jgi:hypothetical protein
MHVPGTHACERPLAFRGRDRGDRPCWTCMRILILSRNHATDRLMVGNLIGIIGMGYPQPRSQCPSSRRSPSQTPPPAPVPQATTVTENTGTTMPPRTTVQITTADFFPDPEVKDHCQQQPPIPSRTRPSKHFGIVRLLPTPDPKPDMEKICSPLPRLTAQ